jgi:hypothetical protein
MLRRSMQHPKEAGMAEDPVYNGRLRNAPAVPAFPAPMVTVGVPSGQLMPSPMAMQMPMTGWMGVPSGHFDGHKATNG